jgi:hypothetical protein
MKFNDSVFINNQDGTFTPALFKGDISDTLAFVKPKEKFFKSGYGTTITCLKKLIVTNIE